MKMFLSVVVEDVCNLKEVFDKIKNLSSKDKLFYIVIILIIQIIIVCFTMMFIEANNYWNSLTPEQKEEIRLKGENNYNYEKTTGIITKIENNHYFNGAHWWETKVTVYCEDLDTEKTYQEKVGGFYRPTLWESKEGDEVEIEIITITDGYGEEKQKYLDNHIKIIN